MGFLIREGKGVWVRGTEAVVKERVLGLGKGMKWGGVLGKRKGFAGGRGEGDGMGGVMGGRNRELRNWDECEYK